MLHYRDSPVVRPSWLLKKLPLCQRDFDHVLADTHNLVQFFKSFLVVLKKRSGRRYFPWFNDVIVRPNALKVDSVMRDHVLHVSSHNYTYSYMLLSALTLAVGAYVETAFQ